MKTPEQFKANLMADMEKKIAEHSMQCAIAECLPVAPSFIHPYPLYKSIGSASYKCETKAEAYALWQAFSEKRPAFITRDRRGTGVRPYNDEKADSLIECISWLEISQHGAKLHFYIDAKPGIVRIDAEMPVYLFGNYRKSDPTKRENFVMEWHPTPDTCAMHRAVTYGRVYPLGNQSGRQFIYAIYELFEIEDQFNKGE